MVMEPLQRRVLLLHFMILVSGINFAVVFVFVLTVMVMFTVIVSGHCSYSLPQRLYS